MSGRLTEGLAQRRPETFVSYRVGLELRQFESNLSKTIKQYDIGGPHGDFMITPIASPRAVYSKGLDDLKVLSGLRLPILEWEAKVSVSISYEPFSSSDGYSEKVFKTLFEHALYLPTQAVIIDCPDCPISQKIVARIINEQIKFKAPRPLILFRVQLGTSWEYEKEEKRNLGLPAINSNAEIGSERGVDLSAESEFESSTPPSVDYHQTEATEYQQTECRVFLDGWTRWNSLRGHLEPDPRIGVCLAVGRDLDFDHEPLQRWAGEPVRVVTLSCDRFVTQSSCQGSTRLAKRLKEFLRTILLANSFLTALVVQAMPGLDMFPYLRYLSHLWASFDKQHFDHLRGWNDNLMIPLQPLSTNLDASTYQAFESNKAKYKKYQEAMAEALDYIVSRAQSRNRFTLMILGAGRGPLVDAMIKAISSLNLESKIFKIYALDKNFSSVQALKEKQALYWSKTSGNITTEIVHADMRYWQPEEKADLITTELLGSFSDNELSPECIDGTWRFSTPSTISVPESYTSYIAPICSFRMHQELNVEQHCNEKPFDQIYIVRFSNIYTISEPQPLFTFVHQDLSKEPEEGANQRQKRLVFTTSVDTVCHGFAGYFAARLFGSSTISTVPSFKTDLMDSWFPAFIPLEKPIQMPANTELELIFSRKDNHTHVWYEWYIVRPEMTRVHSQQGGSSAISKMI